MRTTNTGYKIDGRIFYLGFFIVLGFVFLIMYQHNFDFSTQFYFRCDKESCENPLVNIEDCKQRLTILFIVPLYTAKDCRNNCFEDWCYKEYVPRGEYGKNPKDDFLFTYIWPIIIFIMILAFISNHFIYNKGKKINLGILEFWKSEVNKIEKFFKKLGIEIEGDEDEDKDNSKER